MKKYLVTGGKGFVGSHLVNYLKAKGLYVVSVDIVESSFLKTKEDLFLKLDLRKPEDALLAAFEGDYIFNLAANMGGIGYITKLNAPIMRDNASIHINMLEACRKLENKRIFFSSSACVYPRFLQVVPDAEPLKEVDVTPADPDSAYGWEKLFSEILYKSYEQDYGMDVRIARFQNIYGCHCPYRDGREKFPAALCRKVYEAEDGGPINIWGDGLQKRSYVHVDDVVEAVYLLMGSDYSSPLNIGSDNFVSVNDLTRLVMGIAGKDLSIVNDTSKPQGVRGRRANLSLIREVLGWEAKMYFEEGMTLLYRWVKGQLEE